MLVSEDNRIHHPDPFSQQLVTKVRRSVKKQIAPGESKDGTGASSIIFWIGTLANRTCTSDGRDTYAGATTEQDQLPTKID
jgi:hypothetical protein